KTYTVPFQNLYNYFFVSKNTLVVIYTDLKYLVVPIKKINRNLIEDTISLVIDLKWNRTAEKVLSEETISPEEIEDDYNQFERLNEEYENVNRKMKTEAVNKHMASAAAIGNATRKGGLVDELNSNQI